MRRRSRQDRYGWRSDLRAYDPASSSPSGWVEQLQSASESRPLSTRIGSFVFGRVPGVAGYTAYLAPAISRGDEEGFSSCSACPCVLVTVLSLPPRRGE